jgi:hypothetical protein
LGHVLVSPIKRLTEVLPISSGVEFSNVFGRMLRYEYRERTNGKYETYEKATTE